MPTKWLIHAGVAITPANEISGAAILIEGGKIAAVGSPADIHKPADAELFDSGESVLVPGFIDLHVHGAGGHDVMEATPAALDTIAAMLARHGTTSFVATTVTASPEALSRSASGIASYISARRGKGSSHGARAETLGIHFEGPFISKARRGVHPEEWIAAPSPALLKRFFDAAEGTAKILTLAPELPGALELVDSARTAGVVVSLGHTDATYNQATAAIQHGATHAAHVFNAMRPFTHRDTGVIGAVLTSPELTAELIADNIHVDASAMRILFASKRAEQIALVSDGTAATGMPDGSYRLGEFDVKVSGGVVRNKEGRLAGSALTLDKALQNVVALGVPLRDAIRMLTINPARELGLQSTKGALIPGADADLVILDPKLQILRVMIGGAWVN